MIPSNSIIISDDDSTQRFGLVVKKLANDELVDALGQRSGEFRAHPNKNIPSHPEIVWLRGLKEFGRLRRMGYK